MAVKYRAVKDKAQKKPKVVHVLTTVHRNTVETSRKRMAILDPKDAVEDSNDDSDCSEVDKEK